ncbi:MAG: efflux RND transporter periplasmic adaptor subunit [Acidobacteriota bacterium]
MKKTGFIILPLALMLSLSACSRGKQEATNSNKGEPSAPQTIEVSTSEVIERNMRRSLEVVGSLEAQDDVTISSQLSGNLDEITIDVGSVVRQGQVIARLDPRELRFRAEQQEAALRQAEAKLGVRPGEKIDPQKQPDVRAAKSLLDRARYDWDAAQTLVDKGDISRQQFDVYRRAFEQAEARYEAALENVRNLEAAIEEKRAQLALAKKQLSDTDIVSPISGVVREKLASRGEYLQPGKPIATIVQINPLRLRLEIPESFAATIAQGMTVSLRVDAFADQQFEGKIRRINPSIDEKSRSLIAEAEVSNAGGKLKPGMFARAQIVSDREGVALMVPERAVVSIAGVNKVFVVAGNQAAERMVKLGVRDGSMVEVVEGVRVGERVITSQTDKLQDGAMVSTPVS